MRCPIPEEHRWLQPRLDAWGDWARYDPSGLTLPRMNILARLFTPRGGQDKRTKRSEYRPEIEETERALVLLGQHRDALRHVVVFDICSRYPVRLSAKHLHVSCRTYTDLRHRAYGWLAGYFHGEKPEAHD